MVFLQHLGDVLIWFITTRVCAGMVLSSVSVCWQGLHCGTNGLVTSFLCFLGCPLSPKILLSNETCKWWLVRWYVCSWCVVWWLGGWLPHVSEGSVLCTYMWHLCTQMYCNVMLLKSWNMLINIYRICGNFRGMKISLHRKQTGFLRLYFRGSLSQNFCGFRIRIAS